MDVRAGRSGGQRLDSTPTARGGARPNQINRPSSGVSWCLIVLDERRSTLFRDGSHVITRITKSSFARVSSHEMLKNEEARLRSTHAGVFDFESRATARPGRLVRLEILGGLGTADVPLVRVDIRRGTSTRARRPHAAHVPRRRQGASPTRSARRRHESSRGERWGGHLPYPYPPAHPQARVRARRGHRERRRDHHHQVRSRHRRGRQVRRRRRGTRPRRGRFRRRETRRRRRDERRGRNRGRGRHPRDDADVSSRTSPAISITTATPVSASASRVPVPVPNSPRPSIDPRPPPSVVD